MNTPRSTLHVRLLLMSIATCFPICQAQQIGGTPDDFGPIAVTPRIVVSPDGSELDFFVATNESNPDSNQAVYFVTADGVVTAGPALVSTFSDIGGAGASFATSNLSTNIGSTYTLYGYGGVCSVTSEGGGGGPDPCEFDDGTDPFCSDPPINRPYIEILSEAQRQCNGYGTGATYTMYPAVVLSVHTAPPQISSLSITSDVPGASNTLVITGTNLQDDLYVSRLNITGSGVTLSNQQNGGTGTSISVTYAIDPNATTGTRNITVSTTFGTSNPAAFTVTAPPNPPPPPTPPAPPLSCSNSTVPNAVNLQIQAIGNGSGSQGGTFTVSLPTAQRSNATITVSYGQFSTPGSLASSVASAISRSYLHSGITAQANGPNITLQSWSGFGAVSANSSDSTFGSNIGVPSTLSCMLLPSLPCTGLLPNYEVQRVYGAVKGVGGVLETAHQHIIRKHISGTATTTPLNTVYIPHPGNPGNPVDETFILVQAYNFTTALLNPFPVKGTGYLSHTFTHVTCGPQLPGTGVCKEKGFIGIDGAGSDLYTNRLFLSTDRCTVDTSFPTKP